MSKTCARCGKTVYPIEELKCLDKIWHKQCFKCQVCQMTLNMRNYKGFNKEPYCEAHIPKAKATTVAETPEFRRIAENTKIQSNVKYHADFEKAKGKFTQVADDPETLRIMENSKNISNVAYHGELQKKADMERQRTIGEKPDGVLKTTEMSSGAMRNTGVSQPSPSLHSYGRPTTNMYSSDRGPIGGVPVLDADTALAVEANRSHQHHPPQQRYYGHDDSQASYSSGYSDAMAQSYAINNGRARNYNAAPASFQQPMEANISHQPQRSSGRVFRAMYDYKAQDVDEVSFVEGDLIVNCTPIDEGWLTGVVQRSGKKGMLPANYVTPAI